MPMLSDMNIGAFVSTVSTAVQKRGVRPAPPARFALGGRAKRVIDVAGAAAGLVLLSPLFVLVAIAVKLTSPGPVMYGHRRIGCGEHSFRCWKFRSMVTDGDAVLDRYLARNPEERRAWQCDRKLRNDPRITRVGSVLRAYSIDELPQLLNVLAGSMSLVGPRPVPKDELEMYGDAAAFYLSARPGITGLWQVSGRSDVDYTRRVALDIIYVQNWSMARDVLILLRTVPVVVGARGSY